MSTHHPHTTDRAPIPAAEPMVSAERAFLNDVRLALAVLNWARYPVMRRIYGVSPDQVNLLTIVVALGAVDAVYDALRRFLRHPWPLDGFDTAAAAFAVREGGFGIAGPKLRATHQFGTLIAVAAIGSLTLPAVRRAVHGARVTAHRVGEQRRRIYGAAEAIRQSSPAMAGFVGYRS